MAAQQQQPQAAVAAERRQAPPAAASSLSILAASPLATQLLAAYFACELHASDCYLLCGSVGAGKSFFSRAFIRAAADDDELPVPSPTFLLQNVYTEHEGPPIHHFDLYRLADPRDFARLDLPASFSQAVCLVEWPERLASGSSSGSDSSSGAGGGSAVAIPQPKDPLAVHISIVDAAEQAVLGERLQEQRRQQQAAGSSSAAAGQQPGDGEDDEAALASGDSSSDDEGGGDARWRRIQLLPAGPRWQPRLQLLRRYLQAEGAAAGCYLDPAPEGTDQA